MNRSRYQRRYPQKRRRFRRRRYSRIPKTVTVKSGRPELRCLDFYQDNSVELYHLPTVFNFGGSSNPLKFLTANAAGGMMAVNLIQQGTSINQRIGNVVNITSVAIEGCVEINGTAPSNSACAMLIYDKQPNGAYPSGADLFSSVMQDNSAITDAFPPMLNIVNKERFVMVKKKHMLLDLYSNRLKSFKMFTKKRFTSLYKTSSNPAAISNIATGALYFILCCWEVKTEAPVTTVVPYDIRVRLRFED